jgi:hypothetical protein
MSGLAEQEILHDDGSLTRLSADADAAVQGASVRLTQGSVWHEPPVSAPGEPFAIDVPGARIRGDDAILAVVAERDGTSFVTAVAGTITITGPDPAVELPPLHAAQLSSEGRVLDLIAATEEELDRDPWIAQNITLASSRTAADVAPAGAGEPAEVAREPEPEPEPAPPELPESPDAQSPAVEPVGAFPEPERSSGPIEAGARRRSTRRRALGAVVMLGGLVALVAALVAGRSGGKSTPPPATQASQSFTVQPTRCTSSGDQLLVEGVITNTDKSSHGFRVKVVFTGPATPPTASTEVRDVGAHKTASWKASTPFNGALASITGCQVSEVQPIAG